jgi:hypothetical protein
LISWYDTSELAARPDNSANMRQGYIDGVVNEDAYRREIGAGEADAPSEEDTRTWAYKRMVAAGTADAAAGLAGLTGETPTAAVAAPPAASGGTAAQAAAPATSAVGPPRTNGVPPPAPVTGPPVMAASAATLEKIVAQANGHRLARR